MSLDKILGIDKVNIGIIGSRRRDDQEDYLATRRAFVELLHDLQISSRDVTIVSGGCPKGGDRFAEMIAKEFRVPTIIHLPDRSMLPEEGKQRYHFAKMNYARNTLVANDSDYLIACVSEDRKGGTEDTIKKFLKRPMPKDRVVLV